MSATVFKEKQASYWVLLPLDPTGSLKLECVRSCPHSLNIVPRRGWSDECVHCLAGAALVDFLYRNWSGVNVSCTLFHWTVQGHFFLLCVNGGYLVQHILSHVAHQKIQNLQHKNTHSCPLCSCTPGDMCRTPHTHSHLLPKTKREMHELIIGKHSWSVITWIKTFTFTHVSFRCSGLEPRLARAKYASFNQVGTIVFTDIVTARVPAAVVCQENIRKY